MKPSLPRFIYFTTEHGKYILCTEYPFVVGQVWKFASNADLVTANEKLKSNGAIIMVEDYRVLVVYYTNLQGENLPIKKQENTIYQMSSFFLSRINERPMGWRRYKIEKV